MKSELQPIIRIGLYILAGYMARAGLPPEVTSIVTTDPAMAELFGHALGGVIAGVALIWWRIAKRLGLAT